MNHYYEQYRQIAKDFGLDKRGFLCTLPGINPTDYIMKFDEQNHKIYCAYYLDFGCGYIICCYGNEELSPKLARERMAVLLEQYKQLNIQKKLIKMKEDF